MANDLTGHTGCVDLFYGWVFLSFFSIFLPISEDVQGNHVPPGNFFKPLHKNTTDKLLYLITLLHRNVNMPYIRLQHLPVAQFADLHSRGFRLCTPLNCCHSVDTTQESCTDQTGLSSVLVSVTNLLFFCMQEFGDHPNIVKLLNVIRAQNDKDIYLIFEYMGECCLIVRLQIRV